MNVGDKFELDGYHVTAMIQSANDEFRVIVMHNNSTHYLVATQDINDPEEWAPRGIAKLIAAFQYGWSDVEETASLMYAAALGMAMSVAIGGGE